MINKYIIDSDITHIVLRETDTEYMETLIDTEDLHKLINFKYSWFPAYLQSPKAYYAHCTEYLSSNHGVPINRTIGLQCFVLDLQGNDNCHVDHINHNALDNRKENLRIIKAKNNLTNRKSRNCNNTSGHRNVCKINNKWVVQLQVNGKNTRLKSFPLDKLDEASAYAEEMRQLHYGDFAGFDL